MFWTNTVWYLLLIVITAAEIIIILWKSDDKMYSAAVFLIIAGFTLICEVVIFRILKSYDYYPKFFPDSQFDEGVAGNLCSQFLVTATVLMAAVLDLKPIWYLFIGTAFFGIEALFLKLGIYVNYWYRTWITGATVILMIFLVKKAYKSKWTLKKSFNYYFSFSFGLFALHVPAVLWIQAFAGIVTPSTALFKDAAISFAIAGLFSFYPVMIVCMIVYFARLKAFWKVFLTLFLYALLYFEYKLNVFGLKSGYFLLYSTLNIFGMYFFIFLLEKLLPRSQIQSKASLQ